MYLSAPINKLYKPEIAVGKGKSVIKMPVQPVFYHSAQALHGSAYFKILDDAAFFACNSLINDTFVVTGTFTIKINKPVVDGNLVATGKVVNHSGRKILATATVNNFDTPVAQGEGIFLVSALPLNEEIGYQ